jgi:cathepsin F
MCKSLPPAAKLSGWRDVSADETEMAGDLLATGPLSVLLDAQYLQHYKSGVWDGSINGAGGALKCNSESLDHAVLVTGFGVDGSGSDNNNNNSDNSVEYWSVKNSWGADWGENGFFRIVRGAGECGINTAVTTAII